MGPRSHAPENNVLPVVWRGGEFALQPVLKGGTPDYGGSGTLVLKGSKAEVLIGDNQIELPGKGTILTDKNFSVTEGTVTHTDISNFTGEIEVKDGTLKLAMGKKVTNQDITVRENGVLVNGSTHLGNILLKGGDVEGYQD